MVNDINQKADTQRRSKWPVIVVFGIPLFTFVAFTAWDFFSQAQPVRTDEGFDLPIIAWLVAGLILARLAVELWLARLNRRHVLAHAGEVPGVFKDIIDPATYGKSVEYTLAKGKFGQIEDSYNSAVLLVILFSGILPRAFHLFANSPGSSAWAMAAFLFAVGVAMSLPGLPFDWYAQFRLEEKFGFNTTTPKVWWTDRVKGLLLAVVLGYPLLVLILKLVQWTGNDWWLWAW